MNTSLSVRECIRYGWTTFKQRPWFLVGVTLLITVINLAIPGPGEHQSLPLMAGLTLVSLLLGALVQLGVLNFALRAHDSIAAARLKDLWRPELYLRFLLACVSAFVIVGIPLILMWGIAAALFVFVSWVAFLVAAVPFLAITVFVLLSMYFYSYIVVDKNQGPIAALKESFRITKGSRWKLLQLLIVFALINLLGLLCLIVGLLVSIPITILATVHAYRALERKAPVAA